MCVLIALEQQLNGRVSCRDGSVSMAHQDRLSFRCRVCIPLTGSKILNLFTKLESSKTHESVYTHKKTRIYFHTHPSTLCVKVMGCSGNFSGKSQVGEKLQRLNVRGRFLFLSDISPRTARCRWCHAEVVLCHLLLCVRFRHVEPFSVTCSSFFFVRTEGRQLAAIDNTALKSVFGS